MKSISGQKSNREAGVVFEKHIGWGIREKCNLCNRGVKVTYLYVFMEDLRLHFFQKKCNQIVLCNRKGVRLHFWLHLVTLFVSSISI
jgi:hypothetical protein